MIYNRLIVAAIGFIRLEPYDGKLSRTVLRGGKDSNALLLPDYASVEMLHHPTQQNQYLDGRMVLNCGDATATEIDHEVMKILKESYEQAKELLAANRDAMDEIAAYLIQKETITGKEFMEIFHQVIAKRNGNAEEAVENPEV